MKKNAFWYALILVACAVSLTACMNSTGEPEAVNPTPFAMQTAGATMNGTNATNDPMTQTSAPAQQGAASNTYDWTSNVGQIESRINQISEISESRVVVNEDTALVAVKFAPSYQGELTERIREMIAAVIMEADPSIKTVAVTAEESDVQTVGSIADRIATGTGIQELAEEIEKIVRNATTMR
ncbi:MAG: YhcN/YlaJ family sporulation lipoprotein [Clostridia bacterium]|nr:YhcN/YlaJ family sporulation lipoprotein [Clostridia bacterium]